MPESAQRLKACHTCGSMIIEDCHRCEENQAKATHKYAGFWLRSASFAIDITVVILFTQLYTSFFGFNPTINVVIYYFYRTGLESSKYQGTIGKGIMGLKITDYDGKRISFNKANLRYLAMFVSAIPFAAGFIMAGFTKRKQTLHDHLTQTLIVKVD